MESPRLSVVLLLPLPPQSLALPLLRHPPPEISVSFYVGNRHGMGLRDLEMRTLDLSAGPRGLYPRTE